MSLTRYAARFSAASISPVSGFALRFLRTVILSRLLTPHDLGAAVALVTILASCELITDVGLDSFVMVQRDEARAQAVAAAQRIAIVRAVILAIAITLFAPSLARLFGAATHITSIAWVGIVPVIRSFRNYRTVQIAQEYRYAPEAISTVVGQVGALIVVVPAAHWFADERAMLASLIAEAGLYALFSHLLLRRERVTLLDWAMLRAALRFGLPLMLNGIGLMLLSQLDRLIVANLFDLETLALYSLVLNLAIVPISPLAYVAGNLAMPFLGRWRADPMLSRQASLITFLVLLVGAAAYAVFVGLFLEKLVPLVYGARYVPSPEFCALAAAVAFLRICRCAPTAILLTNSETGRLTLGNIVSGAGILAGYLFALVYHRVEGVLLGLLVGDLLSLIFLVGFTRRYLRARQAVGHAGLLTLVAGLAALEPLAPEGSGIAIRVLIFAGGLVVIALDGFMIYRRFVASFVVAREEFRSR